MSIFSSLFRSSRQFDFKGMTEWHCHILPGVDDGVGNIDDSLAILADYERMGIECVWLTPHIMEDVPNSTTALIERFAELNRRYKGSIRLRLASENMIDKLFTERLEADDVLPIGNRQDMLLVETSYFNPPLNLDKTLERIKAKGYYPLLAHPERYNYLETMADYDRLKAMGVRFQLNLLSLAGYYGKIARDKSLKLLKAGYYDVFGSDIHRPEQLQDLNRLSLSADSYQSLQQIRTKLR